MKTLLNFTVSSLAIGTAFVCTSATDARPTMLTMAPAKAELGASKAADEARAAIGESRFETAVAQAELAVTLSPRSAEHRALLGQAYMKAGRFASAEQSFRDAITLGPAPGRTMLNLALAEIALGRKEAAQSTLAQARGAVADADYGLALALAGDTKGAVAVLEGAARAQGAGPKTRQNLALAYALDGRWREAQTVAAQDVPADELPARLAKWAQFAKPAQPNEQVASLLGVTPAADPGLPTRLALAPAAPEPVALAAAGPQVLPAPVEVPAPAAVAEARPTPASPAKPVMLVAAPKPKPAAPAVSGKGRFVVQLGAYQSAPRLEVAWNRISARATPLQGYSPRSTSFVSGGRRLYRLSVGGFEARADATGLCAGIQAAGGQCFVRSVAGDSPLQWAARKMPMRLAAR
jgi:Flp pilus assembly protein TadD